MPDRTPHRPHYREDRVPDRHQRMAKWDLMEMDSQIKAALGCALFLLIMVIVYILIAIVAGIIG